MEYVIAKWDGNQWSRLPGSIADWIIKFCVAPDGNIYAFGGFKNVIGSACIVNYTGPLGWAEVKNADGSSFAFPGTNIFSAIVADSKNNIYANGNFTDATGKRYFGKWDGKNWSKLGLTTDLATSLVIDRSDSVYIGANDYSGDSQVKKWNGSTWIRLGSPLTTADAAPAGRVLATDPKGNIYSDATLAGGTYITKFSATPNCNLAAPTISSASATIFCQGGSVTLSSNAFTGNQWYKDDVAISGSTAATLNVTIAGNYTVKVSINGCSSIASNSIVVTVNNVPVTPIITAGAGTTLCAGGSITLSSNAATGNQWYKDGVGISSATATTLVVNSSGIYTVIVSSNSCSSSASNGITVTVNAALPTPVITAGGSTTFCQGGSVILASNASTGNQWYKDGIAISGATATTLNVTTSGNYTSKVSLNGCESIVSNSITIAVSISPVTPVITAGGGTTLCAGTTVTLSSSTSTGNQWYKDGVAISGATAITLIVNSSGTYTVISSNGCSSSASNGITVTVNAAIPTPAITAGGSTTFCQGGSVTLTSNASTGNQWYKNGIAINGSTGTTLNVTASGTYTVKTLLNGCESVVSSAIAVTTNSTPLQPSTISGPGLICQNIVQNYSITAVQGATGYTWTLPSGWSGSSTTNVIAATAGSAGGIISVTANNSCGSSTAQTLTVAINPVPTISLQGDTMLISSAAPNYQWYHNNLALQGEVLQRLRIRTTGFYRVETSPDKSCWTASSDFPILIQPPGQVPDVVTMEIYPNPAVGFFNVVIRLPRVNTITAFVIVADVSGNVLLQTNKLIFYGNELKIPITLNATGNFFVKVNVNGDQKTMPVILQ